MSHNFDEYLEEILVQSSSPNRYVRHVLLRLFLGAFWYGGSCSEFRLYRYLIHE